MRPNRLAGIITNMAIPWEGRIHWRQTAPFHIQIELDHEAIRLELSKEYMRWDGARIEGRVVRLFRSDKRLKLGDPVSFRIYVCVPGRGPVGQAWISNEELTRATHVEIYLHGDPPECELAAYEYIFLEDGPTNPPLMSVAQLEQRRAEVKRQRQEIRRAEETNGKNIVDRP